MLLLMLASLAVAALTVLLCVALLEGAAWVAFPIGLALGVIDPLICAGFVLVPWMLGTLVTVVACGLEETGYSNYRRSGDLPRMLLLSATENLGFRQLIDLYRIAGVWDLIRRKRHWGAMHRRGFSARSHKPVPTQPPGPFGV